MVLLIPLLEELLFRGIILRGFLRRYRPMKALFASSILFTVYHLNIYQFFAAFVIGMLLGALYARFGSVWLCFIGHAFANSLVVGLRLLSLHIPGYSLEDATEEAVKFQPLWFDAIGVVALAAGLAWLVRLLRQRKSQGEPPVAVDTEGPEVGA